MIRLPAYLALVCWTWSAVQSAFLNEQIPETLEDGSRRQVKYACEGETLSLKCPAPTVLMVLDASFGRHDTYTCPDQGDTQNTNCHLMDALNIVLLLCFQEKSCQIDVSSVNFADPCLGTSKYLEVHYMCVDKQIIHIMCQKPRLVTTEGFITSPIFPQHYDRNQKCDLSSTQVHFVQLQVLKMDLEKNEKNGTCRDFLFVGNSRGTHVQRPTNQLCGTRHDVEAILGTSFLTVEYLNLHFHSDSVGNDHRGFIIYFKEIEPPKQIGMPRRMVPRDPHLQELRQRGHVENNIDERMRQGANPDASFRDIRPRQGLLVDGEMGVGDCTKKSLTIPEHVMLVHVVEGTSVKARCAPRHHLPPFGTSELDCDRGRWTGELSPCLSDQCGILDPIGHGRVLYKSPEVGAMASYICNPGYHLAGGKGIRICESSLEWSGNPHVCVADHPGSGSLYSPSLPVFPLIAQIVVAAILTSVIIYIRVWYRRKYSRTPRRLHMLRGFTA